MAQTFTDANIKEVIASGRPVIVDFWASWCGPCRAMGPVIDKLAEEYAGKIEVGKYNCDEENDFASDHRIMSLPTILFFKGGEEKPVIRLTASQTYETLVEKANELLG